MKYGIFVEMGVKFFRSILRTLSDQRSDYLQKKAAADRAKRGWIEWRRSDAT